MYKDKGIPDERKIFYTWEDVYACKVMSSKIEAEKYKVRVMKEIDKYSLSSDYVQTQYYCSFNIKGNRFITLEELRELDIFQGDICDNISSLGKSSNSCMVYRIAGFDPATVNDYAAFSIGLAYVHSNGNIIVQLKNIYILNKNMDKISPNELIRRAALLCEEHKIDMIMVDSTGNQEDRSYYLYKELRAIGCNTFVIPYSYGNKNKQKMMGYLEDSFNNKTIIFPKEELRTSHEEYDELLKEMSYLIKESKENGTITYKAPEGSVFFDDLVMSLGQLNYICYYTKMQMKNKKIINLGDGIEYPLRFSINNNGNEEIKITRKSFYNSH